MLILEKHLVHNGWLIINILLAIQTFTCRNAVCFEYSELYHDEYCTCNLCSSHQFKN